MISANRNRWTINILTILRVLVGWHFLYEGITKLVSQAWSSSSFLMDSKWLFAGFFHWIVAHPGVLKVVDILNIWGLIFIGLGLFLGVFTRIASISGASLLLIYYVANPPFVSSVMPAEGHYFIIDKNLIEAAILVVFATFRRDYLWSIDRLFSLLLEKRKEKKFPQQDNHEISESPVNTRREMIKNLAVLPILGGAFFGIAKKYGWMSFEEKNLDEKKVDVISSATVTFKAGENIKELKGKVAKGKIKNVELSRIMAGGNLIAGFAHSRDLIYVSSFMKSYFTDEKVIETLWLCETCGINTAILRTDENTIRILDKYWKRGGKIQWLAQTYPKGDDLTNIQQAIDNGAIGAFVMGGIADTYIKDNQPDKLGKAVSFIRSKGLIGGTAAHALQVPMTCKKEGIEVDFFMKTFHNDNFWSAIPTPKEGRNDFIEQSSGYNDNFWCTNWQEVASYFHETPIPWIAYKVFAAGAINPKVGLKHAFENGADFTCIGMFDFQVVNNANIAYDLFNGKLNRTREWYG
jgi:uncharacterized membrane protein YphA (DoxX/SURF4 family)